MIVALIVAGCGNKSGIDSAKADQKVGSGHECYFRVISALSVQNLKDHDINVISGSVNLTMGKYVEEACNDAPPNETVDSVASYAMDKAFIDQSGF